MSAKPNTAAVSPDVTKHEEKELEGADESSGTDSDELDELDLTRRVRDGQVEEEEGDEEEDDDDSDDDDDGVINVEFEFFDPRPDDFKSVRRLLEHFLPGEEDTFNVSGMADAIVEQKVVGTMVKIEGDPDVYAFSTLLPLHRHKVRRRAADDDAR